jgi:hypothetical protein
MRDRRGMTTGYGFGWFVGRDADGRTWVQHPGGIVGGDAVLRIYPEARAVFAMIANLSFADVAQWVDTVAPDVLRE